MYIKEKTVYAHVLNNVHVTECMHVCTVCMCELTLSGRLIVARVEGGSESRR